MSASTSPIFLALTAGIILPVNIKSIALATDICETEILIYIQLLQTCVI